MKSSAQLSLITVLAVVGAVGHWAADGFPSGSPEKEHVKAVDRGELPPLKEGEVRLEDLEKVDGVLWVDARRKDRWERDGLPGSISITSLSDEDLVTQLGSYENELFGASMMVIYCDDLNCALSHELAERLKSEYSDILPSKDPSKVMILQGGHVALRAAGLIKGSSSSEP